MPMKIIILESTNANAQKYLIKKQHYVKLTKHCFHRNCLIIISKLF